MPLRKACSISAMALLCLGSIAQGQGTTETSAPSAPPAPAAEARAPIFELKSYDLGKITWYASADLPPESTVEAIRARGTPTTPTVTLRSAAQGGTGILFCFVQLPTPLPAGSGGRITIGDIDGNDEAFWNGLPVGSTSGWGVADFRPRMYTIPHHVLKPGVNVFALRMSGPGGRPTFGIKSKTLSFALTPPLDAEVAFADQVTSPVSTISPTAVKSAIAAVDPEVSATLIQRKRPAFGRFGEFEQNGLPAVSEVSPTRLAIHGGPSFDVVLAGVDKVELAKGPDEPGIDGWHTLTRVSGSMRGKPLAYTVRQNLVYPGSIFHLEQGQVFQFRVRFPDKIGHVFPLTDEESAAVFGSKPAGLSVYGLFPEGEFNTPAILAASGLSVNVTQANGQVDISLARGSDSGKDATIYVFYPIGLYRVTMENDPRTLSDVARAVLPGVDPAQVLRQWLRIGLYEPTAIDEYFAPVRGESAIRVYQAAQYRSPAGVDLGGPLLIRPPQVDFAVQALNYPVAGPATSSTGILAFSGDMHYSQPLTADNNLSLTTGSLSNSTDTIQLSSYDLPVPDINERAPVEIYGQEQLKELINQHTLADMGTSVSFTAVDALYKSRTQAFQAYSYLTPEKRQSLAANNAETIVRALGGHFWNSRRERFSGLEYWYTYFVQGPYFKNYDLDWGNGLALYGLATYIKYTGNWALARDNWEAIERMFTWFTVSDDWEWMRASNSAHGHGTGAGDCQNATYAAAVAYTKLAKGADREADYHYGLYTVARAALPTLNRFAYNDFAKSNGFKDEQSIVLGFHEGKGFISGKLNSYPWHVTSNISGNGIQTENFDLYMAYAQDAVRNYEQIFEKSYPNWMDGTHSYPFETLYKGNSGYITLPHIYLRSRLGGDSFPTLKEYLEQARTNSYLWWLAPPVIAEALTKKATGVVVTEWENAAFLGGTITEMENDDDKLRLTLRINNPTDKPNTVAIRLPRRPHRFDINGGPVPLTDSLFENGELRLKIRRQGENVISVVYAER